MDFLVELGVLLFCSGSGLVLAGIGLMIFGTHY